MDNHGTLCSGQPKDISQKKGAAVRETSEVSTNHLRSHGLLETPQSGKEYILPFRMKPGVQKVPHLDFINEKLRIKSFLKANTSRIQIYSPITSVLPDASSIYEWSAKSPKTPFLPKTDGYFKGLVVSD